MKRPSLNDFLAHVESRNPGQPEFLQAVTEVMGSLWPYIEQHPRYAEHGLLTISLPGDEIEALARQVSDPAGSRLSIDLPRQTISAPSSGRVAGFQVDALQKELLLHGIDLVEKTLRDVAIIEAFERAYRSAHRWLR